MPEGALLARIGGEEFCLLLPLTTLAETEQWAERICLESNRQTLHASSGEVTLSISTGAVWVDAKREADADQLLRQADALMYQAKRLGRNTWQTAPYQA